MCLSQRTLSRQSEIADGKNERTFLLRQVTQLRGFTAGEGAAVGE